MGRWIARIGLLLLSLVVLAALAVRTQPARDFLRDRAVAALAAATGTRIRIRALSGSVFRTLVLEGASVAVDGRTILRAPRIELAYHLLPLLRGELRVARIAIDAPRIRLVRTEGGWILPTPRPQEEDDGEPSSFAVVLREVRIRDGRIAAALLDATPPRRFAATALSLDASGRIADAKQSFTVSALRFVPRGVALSPVTMSGDLGVTKDGEIRVGTFDFATTRTHVTASGTVEPEKRIDARLALAPLAASDVRAIVPELGLRADVRGDARLDGAWDAIAAVAGASFAPGGDVRVEARIDAGRRGYDARAELAAVDPGAAVADLPRASLTGRLTARGAGLEPTGLTAYDVSLRDSHVEGRTFEALGVHGRATDGVHRIRGRVRAPAGDAALRARVAIADPIAYAAALRYRIVRLDLLTPDTWGWAIGAAHVRGRGTAPNARRAAGSVVVANAAVHGLPIDRSEVRATLRNERVNVATATVRSTDIALDARASGQLGLARGDLALDASAAADLDAVGLYLARELHGQAKLQATARGEPGTIAVRADASVRRPAYAAINAEQADVRATFDGLGGERATGHLAVRATAVRSGTGPPYATRGDVDWRRRGPIDDVDLVLAAETENGDAQRASARVERTASRSTVTLREILLTPPEGSPWRLAAPAVVRVDSAASTDGIALVAGSQRAALRGRVALTDGTSSAALTLDGVALGPVCALTGGPKCAGRASGRADLAGTPAAPTVAATLDGQDVGVGDVAYGSVDVRGSYAERRMKVTTALRHPEAGTLSADGVVPVDLAWAGPHPDLSTAPLSATLRSDRLDLTFARALAPQAIQTATGRLDVRLDVGGTRAKPTLRGDVALDDGALKLAATGIEYSAIRARLTADGTRLVAREFHAEAGEGRADASGAVELAAAARTVDMTVTLDKFFAVRQTAYEAAASGNVRITGTLDAPDVSGKIVVDRATVRPAALPASGPTIPQDTTIVVVGRPVSAEETRPSAVPTLAENLRAAVTIEVERNAWIRRADADIEIGGKLEVTKAPGDGPRIVGEIRLLRGWYAFQGRRFTIDEGRIVFTGTTPPQPTFDITAIYSTRDYRILVHISGSAEKPTLELTSEPALEKADILAVLLFGKPANSLGRGESAALQQQALALAAGYVIPELRTSVMNALGVETLDVQMPEGSDPGKISAGRYVAEDVFVSLGQEFGRRAAQIVGVEYYLGRNVSVRGSTSTRGDSALDLLWRYRY